MGVKIAEFCVEYGWNYEIVIAILETILIMFAPAALLAVIMYLITKGGK